MQNVSTFKKNLGRDVYTVTEQGVNRYSVAFHDRIDNEIYAKSAKDALKVFRNKQKNRVESLTTVIENLGKTIYKIQDETPEKTEGVHTFSITLLKKKSSKDEPKFSGTDTIYAKTDTEALKQFKEKLKKESLN